MGLEHKRNRKRPPKNRLTPEQKKRRQESIDQTVEHLKAAHGLLADAKKIVREELARRKMTEEMSTTHSEDDSDTQLPPS